MPNMESHWATKERLYGTLVLFLFLGTLFPVLALVSKLAANNFANFYSIVQLVPGMEYLIREYPVLDIGKSFSFVSSWSWHAKWNQRSFPQYALFSLILLGLVLFYRDRINSFLQQVVEWLYVREYSVARKVIVICTTVIAVTFLLKIHLGFWFPGIGGWTYASWKSKLTKDLPDSLILEEKFSLENSYFLTKALILENAGYIPDSGFMTGKAIFLHFSNGEILPGNLELTGLVYPEYVFGRRMDRVGMHQTFFHVIQASLDQRRTGRPFLLPESIAYPSHVKFMPVDYSNYPSSTQLKEITFWTIIVSINHNRHVEIINAYKDLEIKGS